MVSLKEHVNKITRIGIRNGFVEKYGTTRVIDELFSI